MICMKLDFLLSEWRRLSLLQVFLSMRSTIELVMQFILRDLYRKGLLQSLGEALLYKSGPQYILIYYIEQAVGFM